MPARSPDTPCDNRNIPQLVLGGGAAGSGRFFASSVWLVNGCNRFPDLRAAAARKTLKSLKESTWNTIRTVIKQWGGEDEHYHINNVAGTLRFRNDKRDYHARPDRSPLRPRLRAVRLDGGDHCRDEASEVSQKTVEELFSRLRWKTHETFKVSKMLLTPNPTTNWIRSRFVQNDNGERATCREGGGLRPVLRVRQSRHRLPADLRVRAEQDQRPCDERPPAVRQLGLRGGQRHSCLQPLRRGPAFGHGTAGKGV